MNARYFVPFLYVVLQIGAMGQSQRFDAHQVPAFSISAPTSGQWRVAYINTSTGNHAQSGSNGFGNTRGVQNVAAETLSGSAPLLKIYFWRQDSSGTPYPYYWILSYTVGGEGPQENQKGGADWDTPGSPSAADPPPALDDPTGALTGKNTGPYSVTPPDDPGGGDPGGGDPGGGDPGGGDPGGGDPGGGSAPGTYSQTISITNNDPVPIEGTIIGKTEGGQVFYQRQVRIQPGETLNIRVGYNEPFELEFAPFGAPSIDPTIDGAGVPSTQTSTQPGPTVPQSHQTSTGGTAGNGGLTPGTRPGDAEGNADQRGLEMVAALREIRDAVRDVESTTSSAAGEAKSAAGQAKSDAAAAVAAIEQARLSAVANNQALMEQLENSIEFQTTELAEGMADIKDAVENIDINVEAPGSPDDDPIPALPALASLPGLGAAPDDTLPGDLEGGKDTADGALGKVASIKANFGRVQEALFLGRDKLGLSASPGIGAWVWTINTDLFGPLTIDAESLAGWLLDLLRALAVFVLSLWFMSQLIKTTRESVA